MNFTEQSVPHTVADGPFLLTRWEMYDLFTLVMFTSDVPVRGLSYSESAGVWRKELKSLPGTDCTSV